MSLGDRARRFSNSAPPANPANSANPAPLPSGRAVESQRSLATIATLAASSDLASAASTRGRDGNLHPRLARLVQAYAARHLWSDGEHAEAVESALHADDGAAVWRFYGAQCPDQDDRVTCPLCSMLVGIRCRGKELAVDPDGLLPRRCPAYRPIAGDPDTRPGSDRWPNIRPMME